MGSKEFFGHEDFHTKAQIRMFNAKILESNTILYWLKLSVFDESLAFKHIQEQIMEKGKTKCEFYLLRYKELEMFEDNLQ